MSKNRLGGSDPFLSRMIARVVRAPIYACILLGIAWLIYPDFEINLVHKIQRLREQSAFYNLIIMILAVGVIYLFEEIYERIRDRLLNKEYD